MSDSMSRTMIEKINHMRELCKDGEKLTRIGVDYKIRDLFARIDVNCDLLESVINTHFEVYHSSEEVKGGTRKTVLRLKKCSKIDSCYKMNMILDKDYPSDGFYADMMRRVCAECDNYKPTIEGGDLKVVEEAEG